VTCRPEVDEDGMVCGDHGGPWDWHRGCPTQAVLRDVADHRAWQFQNYGTNRDVPDGTGGGVEWLRPVVDAAQSAYTGDFGANVITEIFRAEWDYPKDGSHEAQAAARAQCTWLRMLREEVAEAFEQSDPERLYEELVQVSALSASWAERVRERMK
jgi:hypothetical protein